MKISEPVAVLSDGSKFEEWARTRRRPVVLPGELLSELSDETNMVRIHKLPGTEYHAALAVHGTARCVFGVYFGVQRGKARVVPGPTSWSDGEGYGCGVGRAFGTVDGVPVAIESAPGSTMLEQSLTLSPWMRGRFGPPCSVVASYAPRFSQTELTNAWQQECAGSRCARLRSAALALVAEVQADPQKALRRALDMLSPEQRSAFEAREAHRRDSTSSGTRSSAVTKPDALSDHDPLILPILVDGTLYRVAAGHITIGWRYFRDWRVTFEDLSGDTPDASLAIGMGKGALLDTVVR